MPLALLAAVLAAPPAEAAERRYAVVVGVNEGYSPDAPLRFAESDAGRVADVLQSLGGVAPSDLVLLQGTDATELRGVLADVRERIEREVGAAPGPGADRATLIVYYSGHADPEALRLEGTELPLRELRAAVVDTPAALRILVLDACQAGEVLRLKGGTPVAPFPIVLPEPSDTEGLAVITAAAAGEDAQESDRLQGGVFTHHLVTGLTGAADLSGDQRVTLQEAYRYAYGRTLATTSRAPVVQHPSYAFDLAGQAEVPLTLLDGARRTGQLVLADAGVYVIFDLADTRMIAEAEVEAGGMLALPAGAYRVRKRTPDRVYESVVTVSAGARASVATDAMVPQPYGQVSRRGHTTERYAAVALTLGGGVQGPLLDGLGVAPLGAVGLRVDLPWITLAGRAHYARSTTTNAFLSVEQDAVGGELAALRMADLGRVSLGLGVVGGLGGVWQRFETDGEAPARAAFVGHVGPDARAELALAPRWTLGLEAAWDIHVLPTADGDTTRLSTQAVPRGGIDVTLWIR